MMDAKNINVNTRDQTGNTPLITATWYNESLMAQRLIEKGADVNLKSNFGNTAIMFAVRSGHVTIISAMIKRS